MNNVACSEEFIFKCQVVPYKVQTFFTKHRIWRSCCGACFPAFSGTDNRVGIFCSVHVRQVANTSPQHLCPSTVGMHSQRVYFSLQKKGRNIIQLSPHVSSFQSLYSLAYVACEPLQIFIVPYAFVNIYFVYFSRFPFFYSSLAAIPILYNVSVSYRITHGRVT